SLPWATGLVAIAGAAALLLLAQYAGYASRRHRLTRTSWRGLRLRMSGSAWRYAGKSFGYWLLVIATLGIA
uniref:DUF898 family protein n=1 Tax=Escherichia coli TaxID=562 RepID=UPI0013D7991B